MPPVNKDPATADKRRSAYWRRNLLVVGILLAVWLLVGYGFSIYWIELFNSISIGRLGLGFWFAQQGSIIVFVLLVWIYAFVMDRIDRQFEAGDD